MITTAARSKWPSDIAIENVKIAGLPRACVIRWKLFTLPNDVILKQAGKLAARDRENVAAAAHSILF